MPLLGHTLPLFALNSASNAQYNDMHACMTALALYHQMQLMITNKAVKTGWSAAYSSTIAPIHLE